MYIVAYIEMLIVNVISVGMDVILLGAFGYFTAIILRMHLKFSAMCKIAIHSLTLPIILNAIYLIIETFTSFKIEYFEIMYIAIAYIYIITAILMIKSDIIKNQEELTKILEEQEKVRQELQKQKEEEEAKKEQQRRENEKEKQRKKEKKEDQEDNRR